MTIEKKMHGSTVTFAITGRIDTMTSPELESTVNAGLAGMTALELDFSGVDYISSAGLRVLLMLQKTMNRQGTMVVRNVCPAVKEIFTITGFADILTIE